MCVRSKAGFLFWKCTLIRSLIGHSRDTFGSKTWRSSHYIRRQIEGSGKCRDIQGLLIGDIRDLEKWETLRRDKRTHTSPSPKACLYLSKCFTPWLLFASKPVGFVHFTSYCYLHCDTHTYTCVYIYIYVYISFQYYPLRSGRGRRGVAARKIRRGTNARTMHA